MSIWSGRRVFLTGHTGFKGSWLALWLHDLGAEITGFALPPPTTPSLFEAARIGELVHHIEGDVRDLPALSDAIAAARPEVVLHLAAQPLVRLSYEEPVETYATNVMGTVHVLEAVRRVGGVAALLCVTSDKCYENNETSRPFREGDPMGGADPYSSSKGCAELAIAAYRRSWFDPRAVASHGLALASARAGNVIGGGDWAADRLVPDIVRSMQAATPLEIRSPDSIRPWQHVLEALGGYIHLTKCLIEGDAAKAGAWNFGPAPEDARPVRAIVDQLARLWGGDGDWRPPPGSQPAEAATLTLDCTKAQTELGWRPIMNLDQALNLVVEWHRAHDQGFDAREITLGQIRSYRRAATEARQSMKVVLNA